MSGQVPFSGEALDRSIEQMPRGTIKLEALQQAIRQADQAGDLFWRLRFRCDYIFDVGFVDDKTKALPVCGEFFALLDEYPDGLGNLGEMCRFLAAEPCAELGVNLPQLSMETCEGLLGRLEEQVRRYRKGERLWHWICCEFYAYVDLDRAKEHYAAFQRSKIDIYSDCRACEQDGMVWFALHIGDWPQAQRLAASIFDGSRECHDVPWNTYHSFIEAHLNRGEWKKAQPLARKLLRGGCRDKSDLEYVGSLMRCFAFCQPDTGAALLSRWMKDALGLWDAGRKYYFFKGAWVLCSQLRGMGPLPLDLPQTFPLWRKDGQYGCDALAEWFYAQALDIAQAFDRRNGTGWYGENLALAGRWIREDPL
ncbi:hypothetical protein D1159_07055 [Pseudoflavonifractor sp. 524-17]|uniref:hypothetical protein n=1 Tax=Pseudoflavonifractor sp. 524-17 TaxID=2304577 RepID=UPI00137A6C08|nr:hypothetical protein [Pseudoflavonifractor sp. 524-17]NCE64351.1 hypothetical protein [Pseudoflavonifractor sp. 524-17]